MSKSTAKTYKKTVWKSFARYIKARDANFYGVCVCCTCSKFMEWNSPDCQAGHFVSGRSNNVLFDDQLVYAQCSACNNYGSGRQWEFGKFLMEKFGYDYATLDEMQSRKNIVKKYTMQELKELKEYFDKEADRIIKEKGLI